MSLGTRLSRVHELVKLCADETIEKFDSKVKPVKPEALQIGDKVLIYRPISAQKEAKFDWIDGFVIVDFNDFTARIKNEKSGKLDWVHRRHIRKVQVRPAHLEDDLDDDIESADMITEPSASLKMNQEHSSTGGGENVNVKSAGKTAAQVDSKPKKRRRKIYPAASRKSERSKKPVEIMNINTTKGQSYAVS